MEQVGQGKVRAKPGPDRKQGEQEQQGGGQGGAQVIDPPGKGKALGGGGEGLGPGGQVLLPGREPQQGAGGVGDTAAGGGGEEAGAGGQHPHKGQGEAVKPREPVGGEEDQQQEQEGKKGGKKPPGESVRESACIPILFDGPGGQGLSAPHQGTAGGQPQEKLQPGEEGAHEKVDQRGGDGGGEENGQADAHPEGSEEIFPRRAVPQPDPVGGHKGAEKPDGGAEKGEEHGPASQTVL